jgi:zinc protease
MILCVVGAVDPSAVFDMVVELWEPLNGKRLSSPPLLPSLPEPTAAKSEHVILPGKVQVDLAWGTIGPKRKDQDYLAASVANLVLGGFGLMGRLGLHVREEQGLAYYATSRVAGGLGPGPWVCLAGVAPHHFQRAVATIEQEVSVMRTTPVPVEELEDCKAHLIGSLPLKLESNEGMAGIMTEIELYDLGWDYLTRFPAEVTAVGPEEVLAVMQRHFRPGAAIMASAGPEVAR